MGKKRIPRYQREANSTAAARTRIAADLSKHAPNNSYSPLLFYDDQPFVCIDCGTEEIWSAKQQQWWYEVAKGSVYSRAIRCRACRQKNREKRHERPSAANQPIRHVGTLMKLVRAEIEPAILAAGFVLESRNKPKGPFDRAWIDYHRDDSLFSIAFDACPPRLIAEMLDASGGCRVVAVSEFDAPRTRADIMGTIETFAAAVVEFMTSLRGTRSRRRH
jgi:hypothetical protein